MAAAKKIKLFIPNISTRLQLADPWTFQVHNERRNHAMLIACGAKSKDTSRWGGYSWNDRGNPIATATLPKGTVLVVDRVYIRKGKGMDHFASVTFRIDKGACPDKKFEKCRFWVKLADANKINCVVDELWTDD